MAPVDGSYDDEFDLIERYFVDSSAVSDSVLLGVGDDCALIDPPDGRSLAITTDTLISGVHFPEKTSARDVAYKALAANLSDLAAMGAEPAWCSMSLTLPEVDHDWLRGYSESFLETIERYGVRLIGGDTTHGPLSITINMIGLVDYAQAMRRDTARPGDHIYVSGTLGDAALGLLSVSDDDHTMAIASCVERLNRPTPRIKFALSAARICRCAIDISDGLISDLGHVVRASDVGASIEIDRLPVSEDFESSSFDIATKRELQLCGGDDYELCLTVAPEHSTELEAVAESTGTRFTRIGSVTASGGIRCFDAEGELVEIACEGYKHF